MKLNSEQLTKLTALMGDLNQVIVEAGNLGISAREISLANTKLEEAELWLERFITSTPNVQSDLHSHNLEKAKTDGL